MEERYAMVIAEKLNYFSSSFMIEDGVTPSALASLKMVEIVG